MKDLILLEKLLDDLTAQYQGFRGQSAEAMPDHEQSDGLTAGATDEPLAPMSSRKYKTVRFTDNPSPSSDQHLKPYQDNPCNQSTSDWEATIATNQQMHGYHSQILNEQDEHLDRLGESIGRQRELSMQIGDELDHHVAMLDEVETVTSRHEGRLHRATKALNWVAKGAVEKKQTTAILVLVIVLVLLIALLK